MTHVVVTGSASGIGRAVVEDLLARGCVVTGIDLSESPEESDVLHVTADATDEDAMQAAFQAGVDRFGPATGLVACHGIRGQFIPTMELDLDQARRLIDIHVIGTLIAARCFYRQLPEVATGSIVGISSTTAYNGWVKQADYGPAKAAVMQLVKNLAIEWAPRIRVNAVAPGHTRTPMVQSMIDNGYDMSEVYARNPLGRLAEAAEMAASINSLLLDHTFVTGVCLAVDGGWTAVGK